MTLSAKEVDVANMAIGGIGGNSFTESAQTTTTEGVQANLWYEHCRDSLLKSLDWPFARARVVLTEHADSPSFEWDNQFILPDDFLRVRKDYEVADSDTVESRYEIEGTLLLTNNDTSELKYIRKVADPDDFDPLFKELLILSLKLKMLFPLAGTSPLTMQMHAQINQEFELRKAQAKMVIEAEGPDRGRSDWNLARYMDSTV